MKIFVSSFFGKKYKKLAKKHSGLSKIVDIKIDLLFQNTNHPSLRLHKLTARGVEEWSISIKSDLRIIFQYVDEGILLVNIGSHDEVY